MNAREQAIAEIAALARQHQITLKELQSLLGRQEIEANKKDALILNRVFSYLGGVFILAGISAFIAVAWDQMNSAARIIVTLGPGIVCFVMAIAMAKQSLPRNSFKGLVVLSAIFQCTGLFVAIHELFPGGGDIRVASFIIFSVLAMQYGVVFSKLKSTSFLFFVIYFAAGAFAVAADLFGVPDDLYQFICGVTLIALSYGLQRTHYNSICGFGYFIGSVLLLWSGFDFLEHRWYEIVYLAIPCFMMYVSALVTSRTILITSVLALLGYISYFTEKHFSDSLGWPVYLMLLGVVFFAVGHLALRLNRRLMA